MTGPLDLNLCSLKPLPSIFCLLFTSIIMKTKNNQMLLYKIFFYIVHMFMKFWRFLSCSCSHYLLWKTATSSSGHDLTRFKTKVVERRCFSVNMAPACLNYHNLLYILYILSRASEVGSPTNHPGSRQRQDMGPGILRSVNRWTKHN